MASSITVIENFQILSKYLTTTGSITFIAGIIGNAINILVFTYLKSFGNNRCIFYLTIESISPFLFQFFYIIITILIG